MMALPEGRRGQGVAVALAVLALVVVWVGAISPLLHFFEGRASEMTALHTRAAHMHDLARKLPAIQAAVQERRRHRTGPGPFFTERSDAMAGAQLQKRLDQMARQAGVTVTTMEILPAVAMKDGLQRISLRIALEGRWPQLIAMVAAIEKNRPVLTLPEAAFHVGRLAQDTEDARVTASLVVAGFRTIGGPHAAR